MTNETTNQNERIIYLYRVTCILNNKVYIGQTVNPTSRWRGHCNDSADPKVPFQFAIKKHGNHNFLFEIIASCKGQDNANWLETELVNQYDSYVANGKGYNATHGGYNSPKSEEWKQSMRNWHASMSLEEKEKRSRQQSEAMLNLIATKGHPAQGVKRTPEQLKAWSEQRLANPVNYTTEMRKKMSDSHTGVPLSEEHKKNMTEAIKLAWEKKNAIRYASGEIKCNAPGCDVQGKSEYLIVNEIRYCSLHGKRIQRNGTLTPLPRHIQRNSSSEEREKCGRGRRGKPAHNRIIFTDEQTQRILSDPRSNKKIAKDFGVTEKVIKRIKTTYKP